MMPLAALLALLLTASGSLAASLSPLGDYAPGLGKGNARVATAIGDLSVSLTASPAADLAARTAADPLLDGPTVTPILTGMPLDPYPVSDRWSGPARQTAAGR